MIRGKRVKCYDVNGVERYVMDHEYKALKKEGVVTEKPSKKEEKKEPVKKEPGKKP